MWYKTEGRDGDVVLNARAALSRNLEDYPFTDKMTAEQAKDLIEKMKTVYRAEDGWTVTELDEAGEEQKLALTEQRIISRETAEKKNPAAVLISVILSVRSRTKQRIISNKSNNCTFFAKSGLTRTAISFKIVELDLCDQAVIFAAYSRIYIQQKE